tara:strand:- start:1963 stop:3174 length:1212 start_codon:yes stop_codon:yes gene_type:complete
LGIIIIYFISISLGYSLLRTNFFLNFNENVLIKTTAISLGFLLSYLFSKVNYKKIFIIDKSKIKLKLRYLENLAVITNFISIIGLITFFIFFTNNIDSFSFKNIAGFTIQYRAGYFAGSGLFTGLIIYLLPSLITYLILEKVNLRKILLPTFILSLVCIILGFRYYMLGPIISYFILFLSKNNLIKIIENFNRNKQKIFILMSFLIGIIIFSIIPKFVIKTRTNIDYGFIEFFNSVFGRFDYNYLNSNYFEFNKNQSECFIPFFQYFANCDINQFKYILISPVLGYTYSGTSSGIEIGMIPLFLLLNLSFFELILISFFGSYTVIYSIKYLDNIGNFVNNLSYLKFIKSSFEIYKGFILIQIPILFISAILFDYVNTIFMFERLFIIGLLPVSIYLITKKDNL